MRAFRIFAVLVGFLGVLAALPGDEEATFGPKPEKGRRARVTFFEHADFRGASFTLEPGDKVVNLESRRFSNGAGANDRISSILVEGGAEVIVFEHAGFRGDSIRITRDVRDLTRLRQRGGDDWNDTISSIRVEEGRRHGPPPVVREVERTIWRAYRDLLDRDPDEKGMRHYKRLMLEEDWSERDVRDDIRDSEEYRRKHRGFGG